MASVIKFDPPMNEKARRVIDAIRESLGMLPDPWPSDEDLDALVAGNPVRASSLAPGVFEAVKRELEHQELLRTVDDQPVSRASSDSVLSPPELIARAKQLLSEITPGEWFVAEDGTIRATSGTEVCQTYDGADDAFIAESPQLVRLLLALVSPEARQETEKLDDIARDLFCDLCEGEGQHSEALDRALILKHLKRVGAPSQPAEPAPKYVTGWAALDYGELP